MAKKGRNKVGGRDNDGGGGGRKAWRAAEERKAMAHAYQDVARWRRAQQEKQRHVVRPLTTSAHNNHNPWLLPTNRTRRVGLTQLRGLLEERRWEDRRIDREHRLLRMMRLRGSLTPSSSPANGVLHGHSPAQRAHDPGWLVYDTVIGTSRIGKQPPLLADDEEEELLQDESLLRRRACHFERFGLATSLSETGDVGHDAERDEESGVPSLQVMAALALGPVLEEYVEACGQDMIQAVLGGLPMPLLTLLSVAASRSWRGMTASVAAVLGSSSIHISALCFRQQSTFSSSAEDEDEDDDNDDDDDSKPALSQRHRRRLGRHSRFITNETLLEIMPQLIQGQPESANSFENEDDGVDGDNEKSQDTPIEKGKDDYDGEVHDWEDLLGDDHSDDDKGVSGTPSSGNCSYYHHWALDVSALSWTGCCYLQRLELVNVKHVSTDVFLAFAKACSRLTHLSIANSFSSVSGPPLLIRAGGDEGNGTLMEVVPTLEALDVSFCQWIIDGVLQAFVERWMRAGTASTTSTNRRLCWVGLAGCPAAKLAHEWNLHLEPALQLCTTHGRSHLGLESLYRLLSDKQGSSFSERSARQNSSSLPASVLATTTATGYAHQRQPWAAQPRRILLSSSTTVVSSADEEEEFILCHV